LRGLGAVGALGAPGAGAGACTPVARRSPGRGGGSRGGTVVLSQVDDVSFPTFRQQNTPNFTWQRLVYNTLTEYDHATLRPRPSLATAWETRDGGRTVVLRLREDVRFHSGRPFGPRDVIEMVGWQAGEEGAPGQLRSTAAAVADASATGEHEVTLRLAHGVSNFFDLCEIMFIADHESLAEAESGAVLNGTGPFRLTDHSPGVALRFDRNPDYWKPGLPRLDGVELRIVGEQQAIVASLQSGQTHLGFQLGGNHLHNLRADDRLRIHELASRDYGHYVGCNVEVAPLDDRRVRQAISWAVDREKVLRMVLDSVGATTSIPWAATSPAYDEGAAARYRHDPERARALLREAGAEGASLELAIRTGEPGGDRSTAEIVQDGLRSVGLDASLTVFQPADFQQRLGSATLPGLWVAGHGFGQLDPATLLNGAYPFNATRNASNFTDGRYAELAERAWRATGEEEAAATYAEVTDLLLTEQFVIDLVSGAQSFATTEALRDFGYTMFNALDLDRAHLAGG
ncbi:ABC transporter substrate-binding protein, partial [Streptomyces sp. SBT349]|uniref:ABC transporter substrate-binding protein n=1 Tax=Streptomyces sp. SBT349 TaxID=1580539 RepID=UPI00066D576C